MAGECFDETCSVVHSINPITGALGSDVQLRTGGCLSCSGDGIGVDLAANGAILCNGGLGVNLRPTSPGLEIASNELRVARYGDSAAVAPTSIDQGCYLNIGITTGNRLFVDLQSTQYTNHGGGARVDIPNGPNATSNNSHVLNHQNTTDCPQLVQVGVMEADWILETNNGGAVQEHFMKGGPRIALNQTDITARNSFTQREDFIFRTGIDAFQFERDVHMWTYAIVGVGNTLTAEFNFLVDSISGNLRRATSNNCGYRARHTYTIVHRLAEAI